MRSTIALFMLALSATATAEPTALLNATVYDGTGGPAHTNAVVVVNEGKLECVGKDCQVPKGAEVVDMKGRFITPGLVDAHVHYAASGWFDTRAIMSLTPERYDLEQIQRDLSENYWRWDRAYLCSGVTAVFDPGSFPWTLDLQEPSATSTERPHFVGSGPLLTHTRSPAARKVLESQKALGTSEFLPIGSDQAAIEAVDRLSRMGASAVKVWYDQPDPEFSETLNRRLKLVAKRARKHDLPLVVHAWNLDLAKAAAQAGAKVLVHGVADREVDEEFLRLAKTSGLVYEPTISGAVEWARGEARLFFGEPPEFDDPNGCIDQQTRQLIQREFGEIRPVAREKLSVHDVTDLLVTMGKNLKIMQINLKKIHEYGIPVATSTDAGNPFMFHGPSVYTEMEAMQAAGIPPEDIIVMSTRNGAMAMGELDKLGTLEVGKNADLVILEEDPGESASAFRSITHVMRLGKLHDIKELAGSAPPPKS